MPTIHRAGHRPLARCPVARRARIFQGWLPAGSAYDWPCLDGGRKAGGGHVLQPRLDALPPPQRHLWPELRSTPPSFRPLRRHGAGVAAGASRVGGLLLLLIGPAGRRGGRPWRALQSNPDAQGPDLLRRWRSVGDPRHGPRATGRCRPGSRPGVRPALPRPPRPPGAWSFVSWPNAWCGSSGRRRRCAIPCSSSTT